MDYCSQLWSPADQTSINKLESIQHNLINKIKDKRLENLSYWEKLSELKLYSQERRREQYMVIFIWKIIQGLVSGFDLQFTCGGVRRGTMVIPRQVNKYSPSVVRKAMESSLGVNLLPENVRTMNTQHIDYFKNHLDVFLSSIPDQPTVAGQGRAAESNSLLHQLPLFYQQTM